MSFYKRIICALVLIFAFGNLSYAYNENTVTENSHTITLSLEELDKDTIKELIEQGFKTVTLIKECSDQDINPSITLTKENNDTDDSIKNLIEKDSRPSVLLTEENRDVDSIRNLMKQGYQLSANNKFGNKALLKATRFEHWDIVKALVEGGANVNARDAYSWTPLHYATWKGDVKTVKLLIEKGADVNAEDLLDKTPLMRATTSHYSKPKAHKVEIVQLLLSAGANVNAWWKGGTALHHVAGWGPAELVQLLLSAGANVNLRDGITGETPLMRATSKAHVEIVELLLLAGADVNLRNRRGNTALTIAIKETRNYSKLERLNRMHTIQLLHSAFCTQADLLQGNSNCMAINQ